MVALLVLPVPAAPGAPIVAVTTYSTADGAAGPPSVGPMGMVPSGPADSNADSEVVTSASGLGAPLSAQFCSWMRSGESYEPEGPHSR